MIDPNTYENQFNDWVSNEKIAANFLNYSSQLMYGKGIEVVLFRQNILDVGVTELMRLFSYAKNVIKREINIESALELTKVISTLNLPPSKLDVGLLTAEYIESNANDANAFFNLLLKEVSIPQANSIME